MASAKITIIPPIYKRILSKFPQDFTFCFAYGSAVKKQLKSNNSENMIDLIFCVNNPSAWHEANLVYNSSHYSGLKYFGHNAISQYQQHFGAKVYFNTLVPLEGFLIKYGVVATEDLVTDLLEWSDLYIAGRLHKPVEIIRKPLSSELDTALQLNLQSAVHAALLTLPDSFTEYEFYYTISNLSYGGDFRMTFGENKNKVENIVKPQLLSFRNLYRPFISTLQDYVDFPIFKDEKSGLTEDVLSNAPITKEYDPNELPIHCAQDNSPLARLHHLNQLPRWPQKALTRFWNRGSLRQDTEDVLRAIAYDPDCGLIVNQCVNDIVWKSSVRQSLKSIITAGLFKSVKYSSRKIKKITTMYKYSDTDSTDSDEGIRYKTDSIRNKTSSQAQKINTQCRKRRSRSRSVERKYDRRSERYRKKECSKVSYSRDKIRKEDKKSNSKRSRTEYKESKLYERNLASTSKKSKSEKTRSFKSDRKLKLSGTDLTNDPVKNKTRENSKTDFLGPALPPRLLKNKEKETDNKNIKKTDNNINTDISVGPRLPDLLRDLKDYKMEANRHPDLNVEKHSVNQVLPPHLKYKENEVLQDTIIEMDVIGPALPPSLIKNKQKELEENSQKDAVVGPALPPHFIEKSALKESGTSSQFLGPEPLQHLKDDSETSKPTIGPTLPPHSMQKVLEDSNSFTDLLDEESDVDNNDDDEVYGPVPDSNNYSKAQIALEERALQMKLDKLNPDNEKQKREDWMLELPAAKAANFGLGPRQFRSKAGPDLSDRSSWTDTPEDKAKKKLGKVEAKVDLQKVSEQIQIEKRDGEQEAIAKTLRRNKESLVEIHKKKMKKEKKNKQVPVERRPFSRDVDLQVNKFDEAQKKAVLKKAQLLDSRFSTGESKFL